MVSAPLLGAEVRALGTRGTPGRAAGPCAQARPGTARPCTLDLPRALALPKAAGSRTGVPWPKATSCAWRAAWSRPRRPLSIAGSSAAASARLSLAARSRVSGGARGSVLPGSAALGQPGAQPAVPGLPAASDYYSRASGIGEHLGSCSSQVPGEVKAQLPRDALLNSKGTDRSLENPVFLPQWGWEFPTGAVPCALCWETSPRAGAEKGPFRASVCFYSGAARRGQD